MKTVELRWMQWPIALMIIFSSSSAFSVQTIKIAGSTTVLPITSKAAERFMRRHPETQVTVNAGGSGVGLNSVAANMVDIGLMSREISEKEKKRFKDKKFHVTVVGHDAVAIVVSSEVYKEGVKALTKEQVRDIYLGKIKNWKQVGGPDRPIVVIDKERHRGTRHVFMQYIMGDPYAKAPGARLVTGSNNEEQSKIAQSDSAIGMLSQAWINDDVAGVALMEGDTSVEPTLENIKSKRFAIVRDLNMVTVEKPQGIVLEFIQFVLGPEIQKEIEKDGYVAVKKMGPN